MATTGVNFVFMNDQAGLNGTTVSAIPYVDNFDHQNATQQTARNQGGTSYLGLSNNVSNNQALIDDIMTRADKYSLAAKTGCFHVTTSGTTAVTISLQNLATNATSYSGDTVFATVYALIFYNLSGLDGVAAASMSVAPGASNGALLPLTGTTPALTLPASSRSFLENIAGFAVSSSHTNITLTPTAGGNFAMVVLGA